jgi:CheY-like chemotaxis protein
MHGSIIDSGSFQSKDKLSKTGDVTQISTSFGSLHFGSFCLQSKEGATVTLAKPNGLACSPLGVRLVHRKADVVMNSKRKKAPTKSVKTRNTTPAKKGRILVLDDVEPLREIIGAMLTTAGYEVQLAADGVEALEVLDSGQEFDLLLCNLMMPRLDGQGVLERTRVKFPDMPFVLETAVHEIRVLLAALRSGAYDYLLQPFEREQLLAVVNRAVEYRRLKIENCAL